MPGKNIRALLEDILRSFFRICCQDIQRHQGIDTNCVTKGDDLGKHFVIIFDTNMALFESIIAETLNFKSASDIFDCMKNLDVSMKPKSDVRT